LKIKYRERIAFAGGGRLRISGVQRQEGEIKDQRYIGNLTIGWREKCKRKEADLKDQRYMEECREEDAERWNPFLAMRLARNGFAWLAIYFDEEVVEGCCADC
jgi:hypothetical protein